MTSIPLQRCPGCRADVAAWRVRCPHCGYYAPELRAEAEPAPAQSVEQWAQEFDQKLERQTNRIAWGLYFVGGAIVLGAVVLAPLPTIALCAVALVLMAARRR